MPRAKAPAGWGTRQAFVDKEVLEAWAEEEGDLTDDLGEEVVPPTVVGGLVQAALTNGYGIMLTSTNAGTTLSITLLVGDGRVRRYCRSEAETREACAELSEKIRARPRKRKTG